MVTKHFATSITLSSYRKPLKTVPAVKSQSVLHEPCIALSALMVSVLGARGPSRVWWIDQFRLKATSVVIAAHQTRAIFLNGYNTMLNW